MEMDRRRIFTILVYRPFRGTNLPPDTAGQVTMDERQNRLYRVDGALDIPWFISKEWAAEAGTMALSRGFR